MPVDAGPVLPISISIHDPLASPGAHTCSLPPYCNKGLSEGADDVEEQIGLSTEYIRQTSHLNLVVVELEPLILHVSTPNSLGRIAMPT